MAITITPLEDRYAAAVLDIYQQGIDTGHATFQADAGSWQEWDDSHLKAPRLGAFAGEELAGWAALSATSSRCVYAGVAEISIYVGTDHAGHGVGLMLLEALVAASEEAGIWTLTAGILTENTASIALHEKAGFRIVGTRERLGKMSFGPMAGQWRDVIEMERRSTSEQFN